MAVLKSRGNLLAIAFAASAFLAAFGIALAATVQVSREVETTFALIETQVISNENLGLFTDPEGTDRRSRP